METGYRNEDLPNQHIRVGNSKRRLGQVQSWFDEKPIISPSYDMDMHFDSYQHLSFPLTSNNAAHVAGISNKGRLNEESQSGLSTSSRNGWSNYSPESSGENVGSFDNPPDGASCYVDEDEFSADVSDEMSQSHSTLSKSLGRSSNTSAGPSDVKEELDESIILSETYEVWSPSTSSSSQLSPAKSTTPAGLQPLATDNPKVRRKSTRATVRFRFADLRPRTSIPPNLTPTELARQSINAAYSSRLNPFALHASEYAILRDHICHLHVTAYLNIRNRILRLWVRNPLVSVTPEEAAGCALASRWLGLAEVAYEWLVRKGYINFGCVEVPEAPFAKAKRYKLKRARRKTIVVIGAGMAGLGCGRQLEGLFNHYRGRWTSVGEEPPQVVVLEGRNRIGGRVYSHPLRSQQSRNIPEHSRCTAEMGAHIITGFDRGNPLSMIIRGQLALHYYPLKDNSTLYDLDGQVVAEERDNMVEKLFNDILERASVYRNRATTSVTAEGIKELIEIGRDPLGDFDKSISNAESERNAENPTRAENSTTPVKQIPRGMDKLTGKAHMVEGSRTIAPPALAAQEMGWRLASSVLAYQDLNLDIIANSSKHPTLGAAMDEAVKQYQFLLDLSPQDMRLLNWHYANLEYANAVNIDKLSLGGWDQDIGNEFEGEHTQVIGGYQQVPRGILEYPTKLDLRTRKAAIRIAYNINHGSECMAKVLCEDREIFEADRVVLTTPLGVLKDDAIAFKPDLPDWKTGAIERLGFGLLNKVVLVYDKPFWNVDQDMFGLLREAEVSESIDQEDYAANRGRFYFFWNCIKTSGRPVLISLLAGDAAHLAEAYGDADLVADVTEQLALMFKNKKATQPTETIVTRWGKDRFARGTYSYVGATSEPGDYDAMARPVGNLHFAGEATCGTHPATVHGAYISGLRAASEVIDSLIGPIEIPTPLVPPITKAERAELSTPDDMQPSPSQKRKVSDARPPEAPRDKEARLERFESDILKAIFDALGYRPSKPGNPGSNPFLLFSKDKWAECKIRCDETRRLASGSANTKASKNEVRTAIGQMWREASDEIKKPYIERTESNRLANTETAATFDDRLAAWDAEAMSVRRRYVEEHPDVLSNEEEDAMWRALGVFSSSERRAKKVSGYAEHSGSEADV